MSGFQGFIDLTLRYSDPGPDVTVKHPGVEALLTYHAQRGAWSVLVDESINLLQHYGLIHAEIRLPDGTRLAGPVSRLAVKGNAFDLAAEGDGQDGQL